LTGVALAANVPPSSISVGPGKKSIFYAIQAIVTSLNSTDVAKDALSNLNAALSHAGSIFEEHKNAWEKRNAEGGLIVEGDLQLAQALNASLYFIRSEKTTHMDCRLAV